MVGIRACENLVHPVNQILLFGLELVGDTRGLDGSENARHATSGPGVSGSPMIIELPTPAGNVAPEAHVLIEECLAVKLALEVRVLEKGSLVVATENGAIVG